MKKIPIIYYHSVGLKNPDWNRNFLTLELPFFEDQLGYISKNFKAISLLDYYLIQKGEKPFVDNAIVITFDDGYLDNWIWAYPLLKKYGLKGTIFVSPEFVDTNIEPRTNLEDVWGGKATYTDLKQWGYLSWEEMRIMEQSGVIDIQSHTMTHTMYPVSDKLIDFHRPGADYLYYIGNLFPERKPWSISDSDFEKLLPYGYPVFQMQSSVTARIAEINPLFIKECINAFKGYDFSQFKFGQAFNQITKIYDDYKNTNTLIVSIEDDSMIHNRLRYEVVESKRVIEEKLNKKVDFLCWPHGDNDEYAHQFAIKAGYLATTAGSEENLSGSLERIPVRMGLYHSRNNRFLSMLKVKYKIGFIVGKFPWKQINQVYKLLRYRDASVF